MRDGNRRADGVGQRPADVKFGPRKVAFAEFHRGFGFGLGPRRLEYVVDRARQGRTPVQRALRTFDDFHALQGGKGNRGHAFLDDDAVDEQAGVGPAENVRLAPDYRAEVVAAESLGEIESRRAVGDVLQRHDSLVFQRLFGKRGHRKRNFAKILLDLSGCDYDFFNLDLLLGLGGRRNPGHRGRHRRTQN